MSAAVASKYSNPLVAKYVAALITRPLLVKCATSGTFCFIQEILSSYLAGAKTSAGRGAPALAHILAKANINAIAFKMALYGFFISAPLGHYLNGTVQRFFAGKTSTSAKIGQLLTSNLVVTPIQTFVFLSSTAIIHGASSTNAIMARVAGGFKRMVLAMWVIQPFALAIAQRYVPLELWAPFFNFVGFSFGLLMSTKAKKLAIKKAGAAKDKDTQKSKDGKSA